LISGLRHVSIGADTLAYRDNFYSISNQSWTLIFENFKNILFFGQEGKDPGYTLFVKFIQLFTLNYQVYLIIIAVIFFVPLGKIIYKHSKEPLISYILFGTLFYSFFAITGHRQTIATALVVLIGYEFILKRKMISFLLLVGIAFTIHKSALIFIPFYFVYNLKLNRWHLIIVLTTFVFLMIYRIPYTSLIVNLSGYEYEIYENSQPLTFTIMLLALYLVTIWKLPITNNNCSKSKNYINALVISIILLPLVWVNPNAMRAVQYFSIFIILLAPNLVFSFKAKESPFIYLGILSILIFTFFLNMPSYLFYWQ